jgi:hypothetical protein
LGGDLVDAGVGGPEKVHRARYPQVLEEGERRFAEPVVSLATLETYG